MTRKSTTFAILSGLLLSMASTAQAAGGGPGGEVDAKPSKAEADSDEGPDRTGIYGGASVSFGAIGLTSDQIAMTGRGGLQLGYGVGERSLIGLDGFVTPGAKNICGAVPFGGDLSGTGYAWRGLYFRGGMGLARVNTCHDLESKHRQDAHLGFGGAVGGGYELALTRNTAIGLDVSYDARFVPDSRFPRHSGLAGLRFVWF